MSNKRNSMEEKVNTSSRAGVSETGGGEMGRDRDTFLLALWDFLPVAFFGIGMVVLGGKLGSPLFLCGAFLSFAAGFMKALWKLILSLTGRDIPFMGKQLRYLMPLGFLLLIAGLFLGDKEAGASLLQAAGRFPSLIFFILAGLGIVCMVLCAMRLDKMDKRANRIEQGINSLAQGFVLLGILFL